MPQSVAPGADHVARGAELVAEANRADGLAPMDLERFWHDQAIASRDPFGAEIPQVPLGIMMSGECVFEELGIPEDYWRYDHDEAWRLELNRAYNDLSERIVGRRLLGETPGDPALRWPTTRSLADIFEARNVWIDRSWWLMSAARNPGELRELLDRVDERMSDENARRFILPREWDAEAERLRALGARPPLYRAQRGPITFATSVYGVEPLIYLIMEQPELAGRFSRCILRAMLTLGRVLDEEAGFTQAASPRGFYFLDDNCYLMTPEMYDHFGYPILKGVFDIYSPEPSHPRGQHSDSAMGHLLPILGRLGMHSVNLGPTLRVSEIRRHLPRAVIDGQLAPFTFSRNEEAQIVAEFLRDFDEARAARGLRFCTAGSINNGSRLTGMRLIMAAIQRWGRYDGAA